MAEPESWSAAVAAQLKVSERLQAVERRLALAEAKLEKVESATAPRPESAEAFRVRVLKAIGAS
jgi:lipid II:glycine glycyltransferase (peptidoglycan interpeptide bridge formation enzyme)